MEPRIKKIGSFILLFGLVLFILSLQIKSNLLYTPYILLIIGFSMLAYSAINTREEKSVLCRMGLHKFEMIGWDDEINSRSIYKCKRCRVKKKVFRGV
ncbi:hypothetical protein [Salimicrobium salexigens]|uniref:Uncharacterized protein n=1 Tax=Salimicrobium salexigens TaxID=908941 RepID=A0ABY1KZP8_9BACI|nr:hypothetical protein [Salimicrobium salexigens]SIS98265.1 hypothetical protein SAMN05421758_1161 [Salimicrobium salexigens]